MSTFNAVGKILIGSIFCYLGFGSINREIDVSRSAIDATATVESIRQHKCGARRSRSTCFEHTVTADGQIFTLNLDAPRPIGSQFQIHYRKGHAGADYGLTNRSSFAFASGKTGLFRIAMALGGSVAVLLGLFELMRASAARAELIQQKRTETEIAQEREIQGGKIRCPRCGTPVLQSTLARTNGTCMPCFTVANGGKPYSSPWRG